MKVFISSVIHGLETHREAANRASRALRHEVKRAEDFTASAATPQQACLAGVRWAEVVILILGARYGDRQASGLSATHEEYREARERHPILGCGCGVRPDYGLIALNASLKFRARGARHLSPDTFTF